MQQKEQGKDQSAQGQRNRATTDDGRSAQGAGNDNTSGARDQNAPQTQDGQQIREQSAPSVGHPQEGETTGQGNGVKMQNEQSGQSDSTSGASMGNQDNTSGQTNGDTSQTQGKKKRRMQQ